jgi:type I restriction enzyme S subunit
MYQLRCNTEVCLPGLLELFLRESRTCKRIDEMKTGISDSGLNLTHSRFSTLEVPLPPLNEQKRIIAKIEELFSELDAGEENLRKARRQLGVYRQSLLKQAFEGKLTAAWRDQNPHLLESPEQLLARIDVQREAHHQQQVSDWIEAVKKWQKGSKKNPKPTKPKIPKLCRNEETQSHDGLPLGWIRARLGQIIEEPAYGTSKKCSYDFKGLGVLRIPNIDDGRIDASDLKFASFTETEISQYALNEGDLLMIRSNGSVSIVGTCGLVSAGVSQHLFAGYLIRLRPIPLTIDPAFLISFIRSHDARIQIEGVAKSSSGVNNINTREIQSLGVSICCVAEQQEIVRVLDEQFTVIEQNEREIDAGLKRSQVLRQSILQKAFSGQLVAQDPADEPASVLLERIRKERDACCPPGKRREKNHA